MDKLLVQIGEFLAVDVESVNGIDYFYSCESALKIVTKSGSEILLSLTCLK